MANYACLTDAELTEKVNQSEKGAFHLVYERYWEPLVLHANKMLKDKESAKDLVQEIFLSFWDKIGTYPFTSVKAYLYQSMKNRVINLIEKNKTAEKYRDHLKVVALRSYTDIDFEIQLPRLIRQFESDIQNLPPKMKEVFVLSHKYYMTYKEIAEKLGKSEDNVKHQYYYALKILYAKLYQLLSAILMYLIILFNKL